MKQILLLLLTTMALMCACAGNSHQAQPLQQLQSQQPQQASEQRQQRPMLGMWPRMQWESSTPFTDDMPRQVAVAAHADTIGLRCTNYPSFMHLSTQCRTDTAASYVNGDNAGWYEVTAIDSLLTVTLSENLQNNPRQLRIEVRCGNTRDIFTITQAGGEQ